VKGRRGRRRRKLLDDLKERTGYSYLKEEAVDRTVWRDRFGRGFGPDVRQTAKWMKHYGTILGDSPASEFYMPTFRNTLSHLLRRVGVPTDSVPKRRHLKFRRRGIIQKKSYNIQHMAKVCVTVYTGTFI
jgi:hypothetical protein